MLKEKYILIITNNALGTLITENFRNEAFKLNDCAYSYTCNCIQYTKKEEFFSMGKYEYEHHIKKADVIFYDCDFVNDLQQKYIKEIKNHYKNFLVYIIKKNMKIEIIDNKKEFIIYKNSFQKDLYKCLELLEESL